MDLRLKASLARDIDHRSAAFRAGQARQTALALLERPSDALRVLEGPDRAARAAVLRALLEECQTNADPLWSAILLVAFYPAIRATIRRLHRVADMLGDEIDSIVVEALLRCAASLSLENVGAGLPLILVVEMERRARRVAKAARRRHEKATAYAVETLHVTRDFESPAPDVLHDLAESADVAKALVGCVENLRDEIARRMPDSTIADRERAYQREKRARSRAVLRLRLTNAA